MTEHRRIKACYTVPELAEMMGMDRTAMRRLLVRRSVKIDRTSRVWRVWLLDLRESVPEAWESLIFALELRESK